MTSLSAVFQAAGARFPAVALLAFVLAGPTGTAFAEDAGSSAAATANSPVEEFSQQLEAFQKSVPDLNKTIQDSVGIIDGATDVEKARAEIDKLRETVSTLLGAVSDNGPVSQLGVKALDHVHNKLERLALETRRNSLAFCKTCRTMRILSANFWRSDKPRRR
jgi:hypothetical protein